MEEGPAGRRRAPRGGSGRPREVRAVGRTPHPPRAVVGPSQSPAPPRPAPGGGGGTAPSGSCPAESPAPDLETWGWGLPQILAESGTEAGDPAPLPGRSRLRGVPTRPRARSALRPLLCAKCSRNGPGSQGCLKTRPTLRPRPIFALSGKEESRSGVSEDVHPDRHRCQGPGAGLVDPRCSRGSPRPRTTRLGFHSRADRSRNLGFSGSRLHTGGKTRWNREPNLLPSLTFSAVQRPCAFT